jgi:diguanylate cyclase (GGDEF)-like protein
VDKKRLAEKLEHITHLFKDNPLMVSDNILPVRFSYGIAFFPNDGEDMNELISVADSRMYACKVRKKNKN